jgi:hypothetical protein
MQQSGGFDEPFEQYSAARRKAPQMPPSIARSKLADDQFSGPQPLDGGTDLGR